MHIFSIRLFFVLLLLAVPTSAQAAVRITEIAWMGIEAENGQFGEWIEFYNDGETDVSLAGWKLYGDNGAQLIFTLSKTIPAKGYLLVERTTASMTDPVPGIDDEKGTFGGGGFSNNGEDLILKDASGTAAQSLLFASGWPAGDATTKQTMQWDGGGWVTGPGSPKTGITSEQEIPEDTVEGEVQGATSSNTTPPAKKYTPRMTLDVPSQPYQHVDYTFVAKTMFEDGLYKNKGPVRWNMGDGTFIEQGRLAPVKHQYRYPGTYTIWVGYFKSIFDEEPTLQVSKVLKIGSPSVSISVVDDEAIEILNESDATVDLSRWQLVADGKRFEIPRYTTLATEASVVFSAQTLGFSSLKNISLTRPGGEVLLLGEKRYRSEEEGLKEIKGAQTEESVFDTDAVAIGEEKSLPMQSRTKKLIFGAALLTVLALCLLLERFMAKRE